MTRPGENNTNRAKIQQLLSAIGSRAGDDGKQVDTVDYDWHQPHFYNRQQHAKLSSFTTRVASLIGKKFENLCQHGFEVTITSTSEHFAGQFLGQQPAGQAQEAANYYLPFRQGQETPCGFVSIPPQTAVAWATQLLGDTAKGNNVRPLSDLETSFLYDMAKLVIEAAGEAGEIATTNSPARAQSKEHIFIAASDALTGILPMQLNGSEEFCKITFQIKKAGTEISSEAHILIFCEKLLPAIGEFAQTAGRFSEKEIAGAIQHHIETIPVPVTVQLACVPVTVEQILQLGAGDVLLLDKKVSEPVNLIAAGRTVCRGLCARSGSNYALFVTETLFGTT